MLLVFGYALNLWIWSSTLPFVSYAESIKKAMLLQAIHGGTLLCTIVTLMWLGKVIGKAKFHYQWSKNNWLYVVEFGVVCLILNLLFNHSFSFSDLITTFFPILRDSSPSLVALLLAPFLIQWILGLPKVMQTKFQYGSLGLLAISSVFSVDLIGMNTANSILPFLLFLGIGSTLPTTPKCSQKDKLLTFGAILIGFSLASIMPLVSVMVHGDWSTAGRYITYNNIFLVYAAMQIAKILPTDLLIQSRIGKLVIPLVSIFTLPITNSWLTASLMSLDGGLVKRGVFTVGYTLLGMIVSLVLAYVWQWALTTSVVKRQLAMSLPTNWVTIKERLWCHRWLLLSLAVSYVVALISFFGVETSWRVSVNIQDSIGKNIFIFVFLIRHSMVILTALLIWLLYRTVLAITNRYWLSLGIVSILELSWTFANRLKLNARNEPILPGEVKMYQAYGEILKMVSQGVLLGTLVVLVAVAIGIWYLEHNYPIKVRQMWWQKICYLLVTVITFGSAFWWNHPNNCFAQVVNGFDNQPTFFNQKDGVELNGPLIQFMNNLDVTAMDQPADYSQQTMKKIATRYQKLASSINQTRTNDLSDQAVIFNLSESFADPRRVPGIKVAPSPMPFIDQLKRNATSGLMISSGYGGGTANMEYMTLTGLSIANFKPTLSTPYTQLVPFQKQAWAINQLFKYSVAVHPFVGTFYSRPAAYAAFGFDQFRYLGSKYRIYKQHKIDNSPYLSDRTTYQNALKVLKDGRKSQFMNLISIQNHMPYDQGYFKTLKKYKVKVAEDNATNIDTLNDFVAGIHYTDQAVGEFIKQLDQLKQPVTVVFYGDHLPGIYANSFAEDGLKLHETDYFIYSNRAARAQGAKNLTHNTKYVAPNDFIAMVAEQTNSKVTPYLAFLTAAYHDLPVETMNTNGTSTASYQADPQFVSRQGKIISQKQFTKRQRQLFHDYQLIQYDLTAGKQYLFKFWQMK
ncbi:LTA synthase family protein [Limosilactobacillus ingluviei]|nr:alkaline phosphatase family protein [Limosilactobacillus ingluviei]